MLTLDDTPRMTEISEPRAALALRIDRAFCRRPRATKLIRRFLSEIVSACNAKESTFWVFSADGAHIEGAVNTGEKAALIENAAVPANNSVVGLSATTGISACIGPDDFQNPSIVKITGMPVYAMVVVPVLIDAQICGVVSVVNPLNGGVFSPGDLEMLQWKAYLLGLLIADADGDEK